MKKGVIQILGIFALVGINLSLMYFTRQPEKLTSPESTPFLILEAVIGRLPATLRPRATVPQVFEKRLAISPRQPLLNSDKKITRITAPLLYTFKNSQGDNLGKFSVELYQVTKKPNSHFHIREVDHHNIGYGGGLKIALEIVEAF